MAIHRLAGKFIPLHLLLYLTLHSEFLIRVILIFCNARRSKSCRTLFNSAKQVSTVIPCGRVKELIICRKENNTYILEIARLKLKVLYARLIRLEAIDRADLINFRNTVRTLPLEFA